MAQPSSLCRASASVGAGYLAAAPPGGPTPLALRWPIELAHDTGALTDVFSHGSRLRSIDKPLTSAPGLQGEGASDLL